MHSPAHQRLQPALRRQRCTVQPLFTRPAWPRRALCVAHTIINAHHVSQACMQSPCARLARIMHPTILPRRYPRRPLRTLRLHDRQRASRKLSVHAVALCSPCAYHASHYTAQALRAENAALARSPTRIGRIFGAATTPGR